MKLTLELRAAEGGADAKLLVAEQAAIYQAYAKRQGVPLTVFDRGAG